MLDRWVHRHIDQASVGPKYYFDRLKKIKTVGCFLELRAFITLYFCKVIKK